jgi:hypothetical protein
MKEKKAMEEEQVFRQGDVMLIRISDGTDRRKAIDVGVFKEVPRDNGRVILAYGEVTNHAHALTERGCHLYIDERRPVSEEDVAGIVMRLGGGIPPEPDRLLVVEEPSFLRHEEHGTIPLPVGQYIVRRQREFDPEAERAVAD